MTRTVLDPLLATALAIVLEVEAALGDGAHAVGAVAAVSVLALAWRRVWPGPVLAVLVAALMLQAALGGGLLDGVSALVAVALAAFSFGARAPGTRLLGGSALAAVGLTVANQLDPATSYSAVNDLVFFGLVTGAPALAGRALATRARELAMLRDRTERLAREQEVAVAAAAAEERTRLARAVHEAVAHRVAEIALQAEAAERAPDRALGALAGIEGSARAALDEIRAVIGVLREPGRGAAP